MTNEGMKSREAPQRGLSLSSRTLPEVDPAEMVAAAAAGGFEAAGMWVVPNLWDAATIRSVRERLADTGTRILDVEVLAITPDVSDEALRRIVGIGAEIGARYALAISTENDPAVTAARFARLCECAAEYEMRVCLEFMLFTSVRTLADALSVVQAAAHPAGAVLVDMLHLMRSGGAPADLSNVSPELLPYTQLCDAPASLPDEGLPFLIDEALNGRDLPGEGGLPVAEIVERLPADCALSCEILSASLRERFPDPVDRAKAVAESTRSFLARVEA